MTFSLDKFILVLKISTTTESGGRTPMSQYGWTLSERYPATQDDHYLIFIL